MDLRQQPDRLAISLELSYPPETVWEKPTRLQHAAGRARHMRSSGAYLAESEAASTRAGAR
jgi:hypothetical protein